MALNFPSNPTIGDIYTDTTSGFSYEWDGTVWQSYTAAASKNISILDDISGSFNGTLDTFALTVSGTALIPANAQQLIIVLGGVVQEPVTDYNVSLSNIVFTTPPTGGLSFSGVSLGPSVPVSVPGDGTVTPVKLSTGGPSWNTGGDVLVSGITTISNASGTVTIGIGTTALLVQGNARITGILTVGSSSITIDGNTDTISATSFVGSLTGTASTATAAGTAYGLEGSPNLNVGVVTALSFIGDLTGTASTSTDLLGGNAGVNTTSTPTNLYVSGNAASNIVGLGTTDANTTLDFSVGNNFSLELTGSIVLNNPTGVTTGQSGIIQILQDGVGSRTCGFGSHWDFPSATVPTLSTGANALDCITYFVRSSTSIIANSLIGIGTL
jgi:hypothetical protein